MTGKQREISAVVSASLISYLIVPPSSGSSSAFVESIATSLSVRWQPPRWIARRVNFRSAHRHRAAFSRGRHCDRRPSPLGYRGARRAFLQPRARRRHPRPGRILHGWLVGLHGARRNVLPRHPAPGSTNVSPKPAQSFRARGFTRASIAKRAGARARSAGSHYDLGNEFFQAMLDPWMQYSCALFADGDDLAAAQRRKLEMICQRLQLRPGLRLLDIGCGWGGLAKYAAENYGCSVVGITISREQQEFASNWCRGLDVEIQPPRLPPRSGAHSIARSASEWSSTSATKTIAPICGRSRRSLGKDGRFLCQGICNPVSSFQLDPWIRRYIFPELRPSFACPPDERGRRPVPCRGCAESRAALRSDAPGLGGEFSACLAALREAF